MSCVLGALAKLRKASTGFVMSVCLPAHPSAWKSLARIGQIYIKLDICVFFRKSLEKIQISLNSNNNNGYSIITGTLHEDRHTFMAESLWILFKMRKVRAKSCRDNQNTHFRFQNYLFPENCAIYEIMCQNIVRPDKLQLTLQYGASGLHAGKLRLQNHTQNM